MFNNFKQFSIIYRIYRQIINFTYLVKISNQKTKMTWEINNETEEVGKVGKNGIFFQK